MSSGRSSFADAALLLLFATLLWGGFAAEDPKTEKHDSLSVDRTMDRAAA
jgi:hypothetical protein